MIERKDHFESRFLHMDESYFAVNEKKNEKYEQYILQSVDNALSVLELFIGHDELGISDVAELMQIGKSTAFRLLATLENRGYLLKLPNTRYCLGMKLFSLGTIVNKKLTIINLIHPFLEKLCHETGETAHLVIWYDEKQVIFIDKVLSSAAIRMDSYIGFIKAAHLTASGKALLSSLPEARLKEYAAHTVFTPATPNTILTASQLFRAMEDIRNNGYAIDDQESEPGLVCFAAPIIDATGQALAAVSFSGPSGRMMEHKERNIAILKRIASRIMSSL